MAQTVSNALEGRSQHRGSRRRRHGRARRATVRDAAWLADELSRCASGGLSAARTVVRIADELLRSVERIAWDVREAAEQTSTVWGDLRSEVRQEAGAVAKEVERVKGAPEKYRRLASTALMLGQVALSYRMHTFRSAFVSQASAKEHLAEIHAKNARKFYETSVSQGGAFLKVGQLLSARHDLLPEAWLTELGKLQDSVPAVPFEPLREALEGDLGAPFREVFQAFDVDPIAAASIGQVHRAVMHDGTVVAVKVQRPGIGDLMELDMSLLDLFLESVRSMLPPTDLDTIREEIRSVLRAETDYVLECQTLAKAAEFFSDHPSVVVPEPVSSLSGPRVLVSRFVEGRKITTVLDELRAQRDAGDANAKERLDRIMGLLLEAYLRMVLEAGVFQADPHPGNLLVTADDRLVVLDFGAARAMHEDTRRRYLDVLRAFVFDDKALLVERLSELGFRTASGKPDTLVAFADALLREMRHAVQTGAPFEWPSKEQLMQNAADLLRQADADPVTVLPAEFVMIARVFGTLGGLFAHYRPNVNVAQALLPVIGRAFLTAN